MKLLVAGGRNNYITKDGFGILDDLHRKHGFTELVNGMASGADASARFWASTNKIPIKEFPAQWDKLDVPGAVVKTNKFGKKYNAKSGLDRNLDMAIYMQWEPDNIAVIFPGGNGTDDMYDRCIEFGIETIDLRDRKELVYDKK